MSVAFMSSPIKNTSLACHFAGDIPTVGNLFTNNAGSKRPQGVIVLMRPRFEKLPHCGQNTSRNPSGGRAFPPPPPPMPLRGQASSKLNEKRNESFQKTAAIPMVFQVLMLRKIPPTGARRHKQKTQPRTCPHERTAKACRRIHPGWTSHAPGSSKTNDRTQPARLKGPRFPHAKACGRVA